MNPLIILLFLGFIVAIIILNSNLFHKQDPRKRYLEALAKYLEGRLEVLTEPENSYRIHFDYEGHSFLYEDLVDLGFQTKFYKGYIKVPTPRRFTLSFTEKPRSSIKVNVKGLSDFTTLWADDSGPVRLPKELKEFNVFSNDPQKAIKLLEYEDVIEVFAQFKNLDPLGHPVMSLEIVEGVVTLRFHPPGELKPNISDLMNNVSIIDEYLDRLLVVIKRLKSIKDE